MLDVRHGGCKRASGRSGMLMYILTEPIELVQIYFDKKSSEKCKSINVKFTTFRHRTIVHRLKKNMKDNIKIHVDLTKKSIAY